MRFCKFQGGLSVFVLVFFLRSLRASELKNNVSKRTAAQGLGGRLLTLPFASAANTGTQRHFKAWDS